MTEAGININDVARHFGFHKTSAYRTINRLANRVGRRPPEIGQAEKKLNPLEEHFFYSTSRRERFLSANRFTEV